MTLSALRALIPPLLALCLCGCDQPRPARVEWVNRPSVGQSVRERDNALARWVVVYVGRDHVLVVEEKAWNAETKDFEGVKEPRRLAIDAVIPVGEPECVELVLR